MTQENSKIAKDGAKPASPENLVKASPNGTVELSESELDKASGGAMKTYLKTADITPVGQ